MAVNNAGVSGMGALPAIDEQQRTANLPSTSPWTSTWHARRGCSRYRTSGAAPMIDTTARAPDELIDYISIGRGGSAQVVRHIRRLPQAAMTPLKRPAPNSASNAEPENSDNTTTMRKGLVR